MTKFQCKCYPLNYGRYVLKTRQGVVRVVLISVDRGRAPTSTEPVPAGADADEPVEPPFGDETPLAGRRNTVLSLLAGLMMKVRANQGVAQTLSRIRNGNRAFVITYAVATLDDLVSITPASDIVKLLKS